MNERLRIFAERHPLGLAVLAGAFARIVAATMGAGFHARDDYFHVLVPALRWVADPTFDWDASGLPGAGLRSHLVPRLVASAVRLGHDLGVTEPESMLRWLYLWVGAYGLLVVPGVYLLASRLLSRRGQLVATWLAALHFAMPYAGTRLLIEAMAMPPLVFGLWLVTFPTTRRIALGGLLIGLACWFRFQLGIAALALAGVLAWQAWRAEGEARVARVLRTVGALALGGLLAVVLQGGYDTLTTGRFLGPVLANVAYNAAPPAELTRSGAFTYVGLWLLLTVPPATLWLAPALWLTARRLALVVWPFLAFVVVHSLVPHKEERFMLPVLPLFLVWLAACVDEIAAGSHPFLARLARFRRPMTWWVVGVHAAALLVAVTSQSQASVQAAMTAMRHDTAARALVIVGPEVQDYFLAREHLEVRRARDLDAVWLARTRDALADEGLGLDRVMAFAPERGKLELLLAAMGYDCAVQGEFAGYWLDRLIYRINPRHNRRRSPVLIWSCRAPAVAMSTRILDERVAVE